MKGRERRKEVMRKGGGKGKRKGREEEKVKAREGRRVGGNGMK